MGTMSPTHDLESVGYRGTTQYRLDSSTWIKILYYASFTTNVASEPQMGIQTNKIILATLAALFLSHSQNGGAARVDRRKCPEKKERTCLHENFSIVRGLDYKFWPPLRWLCFCLGLFVGWFVCLNENRIIQKKLLLNFRDFFIGIGLTGQERTD